MKEKKIAILGLGYVGLPLALQLSFSYNVVGYDIDDIRIKELRKGIDKTLEISERFLKKQQNNNLFFTTNPKDILNCNFYIATVPTPIDMKKKISTGVFSSKVASVLVSNSSTVIKTSLAFATIVTSLVPILTLLPVTETFALPMITSSPIATLILDPRTLTNALGLKPTSEKAAAEKEVAPKYMRDYLAVQGILLDPTKDCPIAQYT